MGNSYSWNIPDNPSGIAWYESVKTIRIRSLSDVADAKFSIVPAPVITVTSPNGGEKLKPQSIHNITWTGSEVQGRCKIEYSTDNGATWNNHACRRYQWANGSHNWTVPDNPSKICLIRISESPMANLRM